MGIFIALLVLSFLIFFHELGHFSVARLFGVRVDTFSIGFGKKLLSKKIGDTEWTISLIPLGGYVKMKGQDDTNPLNVSHDEDSYTSKKPWQRILILLAGPLANFLVAFFIYFGISQIGTHSSPLFDYGHYISPTVGDFAEESPAKEAGIKVGDKILKVNGREIESWNDIGEAIQSYSGTLNLSIIRDGKERVEFKIEPIVKEYKNRFGETIQKRFIGVAPKSDNLFTFSPIEGLAFALHETVYASTVIFKSLEKLITGDVPAKELGGVISIVDVTAKASESGLLVFLFFTALISVNLGVLNLLPIPALDGGHIMFNIYEIVRGKAPSESIIYKITIVGWGILLSIMLLGLYNDINRLFG